MKKSRIASAFLVLSLIFVLSSCSTGTQTASQTPEEDKETASTSPSESASPSSDNEEAVVLTVFAAASMTETIDEIVEMYKQVAPNVTIRCNYDSSGTLVTQIEEGADCDIFISAAQKQMNQIDGSKDESVNPDGNDFVLQDTRIDLLENKVTLVVPEGNPADIESFEDLAGDKLELIALGNSDVPVGQYSEEILTNLGIWDTLNSENKITYGSNVKEVTTLVDQAAVSCGIIYATDAYSAGLTVVAEADSSMCAQVIYPAAVLKITQNEQAARDFLEYLQTDECSEVFQSVGFAMATALG